MTDFIPVNDSFEAKNEKKYLIECVETGWLSSAGQFVKKLERDFSSYTGQKYGSCVQNGSVALELAVKVLKEQYHWEKDDEIILPSFTIISSAQAVVYNGLKPIFVDSNQSTWNMDVSKIEEKITPKTKAVMAVHIYGLPTDMNPIFELAKKYDLKIIEDAAQAHGLKYYDKCCGSMSDISTFSFYANKHISAGEGGMVMTSDENLLEKINYYKNLCHSKDRFVHYDLGWNYRMSNLQAAVAYAQFEELDDSIKKKKLMGKLYTELLKDIPAQLPVSKTDYAENNYWVYGIVLNDDVKFDAKEAMKKLSEKNIGVRPFFCPMHKQPVFVKMGLTDETIRPISEKLYERGFYIPSGINITTEQIETVAKKIKEIF